MSKTSNIDKLVANGTYRPLSARSIVASLLLGMREPKRSGADLVRWCGLFGVSQGTARVALSRMVDNAELRNDAGVYELVGRLRERVREHDLARAPALRIWNGDWLIAVVTADTRNVEDRNAIRLEMRHHHYAEQREGVWTRPDNLVSESMPYRDAQCRLWVGSPIDPQGALAEALFAPQAWALRARPLILELVRGHAALAAGDVDDGIRAAFLASTAALAHLRADPLLPNELVGAHWPGDELRDAYRQCVEEFDYAVKHWFRSGS